MSRSLSSDSQSKSSGNSTPENIKVDFSKLDMPALLNYCKHYNLGVANPNPSKEQLIDIVQKHFMSQQMDEHQVIGRLSNDSQSKSSGSTPENMKVDFSKLEMPALLRYCQHYNLLGANLNQSMEQRIDFIQKHFMYQDSKEQLIDIIQKHFMSQQVDEHQVIERFVQALQSEDTGKH